MARRNRPSVTVSCVADRYASPAERIVEFNANDGSGDGGLISIRRRVTDNALIVDVYRTSGPVLVFGAAHAAESTTPPPCGPLPGS